MDPNLIESRIAKIEEEIEIVNKGISTIGLWISIVEASLSYKNKRSTYEQFQEIIQAKINRLEGLTEFPDEVASLQVQRGEIANMSNEELRDEKQSLRNKEQALRDEKQSLRNKEQSLRNKEQSLRQEKLDGIALSLSSFFLSFLFSISSSFQ